jgi:hypothetical protein
MWVAKHRYVFFFWNLFCGCVIPSVASVCSLAVSHIYYLQPFYKHGKSSTLTLITAPSKSSKVMSHTLVSLTAPSAYNRVSYRLCVSHCLLRLSAIFERQVAVLSLLINTVEVAGPNLNWLSYFDMCVFTCNSLKKELEKYLETSWAALVQFLIKKEKNYTWLTVATLWSYSSSQSTTLELSNSKKLSPSLEAESFFRSWVLL